MEVYESHPGIEILGEKSRGILLYVSNEFLRDVNLEQHDEGIVYRTSGEYLAQGSFCFGGDMSDPSRALYRYESRASIRSDIRSRGHLIGISEPVPDTLEVLPDCSDGTCGICYNQISENGKLLSESKYEFPAHHSCIQDVLSDISENLSPIAVAHLV